MRRARFGVILSFFLTGLVFATWASRVPAIRHDLSLGDGQLAVAFMGLNAGAIVGLQLSGVLIPRTGSRSALRAALPAFAASLILPALAWNLSTLTAALFLAATLNSVVDVGMNAHGIALERRYGRPILSRLHAMHPLGGMVGAGIGALAAWFTVGAIVHFFAVAVAVGAAAFAATGLLLPATIDAAPAERTDRHRAEVTVGWLRAWSGRVAVFGVLAFCVTLAEGAALDWSAVYLHDALRAHPSVAAAGVAVFLAGLTLGRFAGDGLVLRYGPVVMFRCGSLFGGLGFSAALLVNAPIAGIIGLALLGAGTSFLMPLLFSVAGKLHEQESAAASAIARVSTLGYLGSFVGPALIGLLAEAMSLPIALALPAVLVVVTALAARTVAPAVTGDAKDEEPEPTISSQEHEGIAP